MDVTKKTLKRIALLLIIVPGIFTMTVSGKPSDNFTLHIDATKHFPSNPDIIAHHYCKVVTGGLIECMLFDSDLEDARLVGVETVVNPEIYNKFDEAEKALWHYHKAEFPRVDVKLPDLSPEEADKVIKSLEETYGKLYILWDPGKSDLPLGRPDITVLDHPSGQTPKTPAFEVISAITIVLLAVLFRKR